MSDVKALIFFQSWADLRERSAPLPPLYEGETEAEPGKRVLGPTSEFLRLLNPVPLPLSSPSPRASPPHFRLKKKNLLPEDSHTLNVWRVLSCHPG